MTVTIGRRELLVALGGAATWPLAQHGGRMRRNGVLMSTAADDPESPLRIAAFAHGLSRLAVGGS